MVARFLIVSKSSGFPLRPTTPAKDAAIGRYILITLGSPGKNLQIIFEIFWAYFAIVPLIPPAVGSTPADGALRPIAIATCNNCEVIAKDIIAAFLGFEAILKFGFFKH